MGIIGNRSMITFRGGGGTFLAGIIMVFDSTLDGSGGGASRNTKVGGVSGLAGC